MRSKNKEDYICLTPFGYTEVFDKQQFLCCPGWLKEDIYETESIKDNFFSEKSKKIRASIVDGSYKYCDAKQCEHLQQLKAGKFIDGRFVEKNQENIDRYTKNYTLNMVNFCFDRSCNLQCPSCRVDLINYLGKERKSVDIKLEELDNEISKTVKRMYITGTADPFYSKSFRQFLINFQPSNYPMMESIHIHTNGILWTEQLWNRMDGIHPFVKSCEISIDAASKNTYEKEVRIGGDWEVLMKQLKFIVNIPTINHFSFSFVVQDKNYKEMYDFYKLITDLTDGINKSISIFFNHIVNWGTYTEEEFLIRDVANKSNELHSDFLLELQKIHNQKNVSHNFNYLLKKKINLI